ncbi:MAG: DUF1343 domain-containing protein [Undibacterium sp.]|nr:DUF1343 domain-containing protein [Opitutaceae bacterium]
MPALPRRLLVFAALAFTTALPAATTFKPDKLAAMDAAITEAIAAKKIPGGVLWFQRDDEVYQKSFGRRATSPTAEPISADTIYDAASLTKAAATTTAIMQLVERGRLDLDSPVVRYLSAFEHNDKSEVTVRQLLTHHSGLRPDVDLKPAWSGYATGVALACAEKLRSAPGSTFVYSDINFIVLGELVRIASGQRLDAYAAQHIFQPLGMSDTGFLPPAAKFARVAPTEISDGVMLRGVVHDPTARAMEGVAGHAGLFTTAADLARFCRMLIGNGQLDDVRILSAASVAAMSHVQTEGSNRRGLGWDIDSGFSGPRGRWFPAGASFGHTGFTGTSVWVDPAAHAFIIFLSNRVHPDGKGDTGPLRRALATLAAEAIGRDAGAVLNGIDVLVREDFARLRGLRIGLITNQTGRDRDGRTTIDLLHEAKEVKLVALFSPEHGIRGVADDHVGDSIDDKTKLPVYSLYGESPPRTKDQSDTDYTMAVMRARAPQPEQLRELDALVFDIQDIGARFYTYSATLGVALEAAAKARIKFIVLDRVNPIGGINVEGPVMTRAPSFIGFHPMPVRHGMTLGELAQMYDAERHFGADLTVVRCENWTRDLRLDQTGLPWINPSPSMRSLTAATLYPGLCLLESTQLSMGRGTTKPFEQVGAPFIDGGRLAAALNRAGLAGVRFEPVKFTPRPALYPGPAASLKDRDQACGGVRVVLTDAAHCPVVDIGLELAVTLQRLYPEQMKISGMARLLGDDATLEAILAGKSSAEIKAGWAKGLADFNTRRNQFLLYP